MHFAVYVEKLAAGSTKILISNGGVVASLTLFTPDPDVARFLLFSHCRSIPYTVSWYQ
jgi:hypothetical protein